MTSSFVNYVSSFWEPLASSAASKTKSPSSSPSSSSSSSHFTNPDEWRSEMISLDVARAKFMMQQESTFQKEKENLLLDVMTFTCYEATKDALLSYKKQNQTNSSSSSSETHNVNNGCNDESSSLVVVLSKLNQRAIQYYQHGQYPEAFLYFSSAMVFALDQMNRKEWEHYKHSICQMGTIQLTKRIYKHMSLEVLSLLEEEEEYEEYHQDDDEQQEEHHHHHQHEEFHRNSDNSKEQNDEKEEDEGTNNYRQSRSSFFYNGVESIPIVDNHETKQEQLPHHRRKPKPQKSQKRQSTKDSSDNSNNSDSLMLLASMVGTLWFNMAQTHRSWGNYYQSIICYQRACLSCPLLPLVRSIRNMTALFVCAVGEIDAPQLVHKVLGPTYAKSIVLEAQEAYETLVLCNTNNNNNNNNTCTTNIREETESSLGGTTTTDTTLNENERQHQHGDHPHTLLGIHKGKEEDLVGEEEEKQQTI